MRGFFMGVAMTDDIARFGLEVDSSGVVRATNALDKLNETGSKTEQALGGLSRAFSMIASGLSIQQTIQAADAWQGYENRIRLVTKSQEDLGRAMGDIYRIAQNTSASLDASTQVYQRFAQNAGALGLNLSQVARLTETVSKAVAVSGASAGAADAALMQFGQALASGVLRGEEFNSIMEQTPSLMAAIAEGMGRTVGEMRDLAAEGKITGQAIVDALTAASESVDAQFATRIKTVTQSMTELSNAFTKLVGETSQQTMATQALSGGIGLLAENLSTVVAVAAGFGTVRLAAWLGEWTTKTYESVTASQARVAATLAEARADASAAQAQMARLSTTQAMLAISREEAIAKLASANASMGEARAHLQAAQAVGAHSAALRAQAIARAQLAASQAQQSAALAALATLGKQQAAVSAQITAATAAQTAAQTSLASATAAASVGVRAAGAAMTIAGGPIGLATAAVLAGVAAWSAYSDSAEETRVSLTGLGESIDEVKRKYEELNKVEQQRAIEGLRDAIKQAQAELADAFKDMENVPLRLRASVDFSDFRDQIKQLAESNLSVKELEFEVHRLSESFKAATPDAKAAHDAVDRLASATIEASRAVNELKTRYEALSPAASDTANALDKAAIAAAQAAAGLQADKWQEYISKLETAAATVGMTAQQLAEFDASSKGASDAQAQLAGVLAGSEDAAKRLLKATEDKDAKAIKGASEMLAALAAQEVQLRVNVAQAQAYAELLAMGLSQASALQGAQTEGELAGLRYQEEVLARIQALRKNIASSAAAGAGAGKKPRSASEAEQMLKQIESSIVALKAEAAAAGETSEAKKELAKFEQLLLVTKDASLKKSAALIRAALNEKAAQEQLTKYAKLDVELRKEYLDSIDDQVEAASEQAFALEKQIATFGMTESAVMALEAAEADEAAMKLESARAAKIMSGASAEVVAQYDEEIAKLRDLGRVRRMVAGLQDQVESRELAERAADDWAQEWERANEQIGQSLTDALMRGFEDGKGFAENFRDALTNIFQTMILRPIIEPVVKEAAGTVRSLTGTGPRVGPGGIPDASFLRSSAFSPGAGMGTEFLANSWGQVGGDSMEALIAGNSSNWGVQSNMAGKLSAGLGYATAIYALTEKQYATAIGTAVGTYILPGIGTAIGSMLGGMVDGIIGDFSGETRFGGSYYVGDLADGTKSYLSERPTATRAVYEGGPSGGDPAADQASRLLVSTFASFSDAAKTLGGAAEDLALFGSWEVSPEKGNSFVRTIVTDGSQDLYDSRLDLKGVKDSEEVFAAFQAELPKLIIAGLQQVDLDDAFDTFLDQIDIASLDETGVQQVLATLDAMVRFRDTLAGLPFDDMAGITLEAGMRLAEFSGGMDTLLGNMQTYYDLVYSEEEKVVHLQGQLTKAFADLGYALPGSTAELRALAEGLDITTDAGLQARAGVYALAGSFGQLQAALDQAAQAQRQAAQQALDDAQRAAYEAAVAARQAAERGANDAMAILTNAVNRQKSALQKEYDEIAKGLNEAISTSQTALSNLESLADRLQSTLHTMLGRADAAMTRAAAQAQIERALSVAKLTGVLPSGQAFENALQAVAQPSEDLFATFADYQTDFLRTANDIYALNELTGEQLSIEELTLQALKDQLEAETDQFEQQMEYYDLMLETAQDQLAEAMGTKLAVMSLEGAMANFASAIAKLKATPVPSAPSAPEKGGYINDIYRDLFGRDAEQAGVDYWTGRVEAGLSVSDLERAIREAAGTEDRKKLLRGFASGGYAAPGWAMVGEEGPELVNFSQPGRVYTAQQTREMMTMPPWSASDRDKADQALLEELRQVNTRLQRLESVGVSTAQHTNKAAKLIERAMPNGNAFAIEEITA